MYNVEGMERVYAATSYRRYGHGVSNDNVEGNSVGNDSIVHNVEEKIKL